MHGADGVEILSTPDHLVAPAASALGWDGVVLSPVMLLGRRVVVVAELIRSVHEQRVVSGWGPVTDRTSVGTWQWPEMAHLAPRPAVRLCGVLAPARHWRTGLTAAVPFTGMCPTALLLPAHIARDPHCLQQADRYGPTVIATVGMSDVDPDAVDVVQMGRAAPMSPRVTAVSRWVHEVVYDQLVG